MANLPPADSLEGMARWMQGVEDELSKLKSGSMLSGQVSVGSLRVGGLLIVAGTDPLTGLPALFLRRDASGGPSAQISTLPPD